MNDPRHAEAKRAAQEERERFIEAFNRWNREHSHLDIEVIDWAIRMQYSPNDPVHVSMVRIYADGYAEGLIDGHNEAMNGHECE